MRFLTLSTHTSSSAKMISKQFTKSCISSKTIVCLHRSTNLDASPLYARYNFSTQRWGFFNCAHAIELSESEAVPRSLQRPNVFDLTPSISFMYMPFEFVAHVLSLERRMMSIPHA